MPSEIRKGTGNGVSIAQSAELKYLEISGAGIDLAMKHFEAARDNFFEEAECVETFGKNDAPPQTAFEVSAKLGPQQSKQALLREQYGQHGVRPLLEMAVGVERALNARGEGMVLEPRVVKPKADGEEETVEQVQLGPGGFIEVNWPPISRPTPSEVGAATTAAVAAVQGAVIDEELALQYLAPYFGADDVHALKIRMTKAKEEREKQAAAQGLPLPAPGQKPPVKPLAPTAPAVG